MLRLRRLRLVGIGDTVVHFKQLALVINAHNLGITQHRYRLTPVLLIERVVLVAKPHVPVFAHNPLVILLYFIRRRGELFKAALFLLRKYFQRPPQRGSMFAPIGEDHLFIHVRLCLIKPLPFIPVRLIEPPDVWNRSFNLSFLFRISRRQAFNHHAVMRRETFVCRVEQRLITRRFQRETFRVVARRLRRNPANLA